jgi:hypothetical protein
VLRGRDVDDVIELKRQGCIRAISRLTGYNCKMISRYLSTPNSRPLYGQGFRRIASWSRSRCI